MNLKQGMLSAPDEQIDQSVKDIIARVWDDEPTSIQILEALDFGVHTGTISDFVVQALDAFFNSAIKKEGTTMDEVLKLATWRENA